MIALEISQYIIEYAYNNKSPISNFQLQKILYFLWIDFYREYKEYLFRDTFEAGVIGPYIRSIYYEYCNFGSMTILPFIVGFSNVHLTLTEDKLSSINKILDKYISIGTNDLIKMSCSLGSAWDITYRNREINTSEIPFDTIIKLECIQ